MRAAGKWTTPGAAASGKRALVDVKDRDAREAVRLEIGGAGQSVRGEGLGWFVYSIASRIPRQAGYFEHPQNG